VKLDAAVFAAYGWPEELTAEEILERLPAVEPGAGRGRRPILVRRGAFAMIL